MASQFLLHLLLYLHAPFVVVSYLVTLGVNICIRPSAKELPKKRRSALIILIFVFFASYVAEIIVSDQHPSFDVDCFLSILFWPILLVSVLNNSRVQWLPYLVAFGVEIFFGVVLLVCQHLMGLHNGWYKGIFIFRAVTPVLGLALTARRTRRTTETTPLMHEEAGYNALDRPKIEENQRKEVLLNRLQQFRLFLPHLFPKNRTLYACFALRFIHIVISRAANNLVPRQMGHIIDSIDQSSMPWMQLLILFFYKIMGSTAGTGALSQLAASYVTAAAENALRLFGYDHIMNLSMEFHVKEKSGDIIRGIDDSTALVSILNNLQYGPVPVALDFIVATSYNIHIFSIKMAFLIYSLGFIYIWISWFAEERLRPLSIDALEKDRKASAISNETIRNWSTVNHFNRKNYEYTRYKQSLESHAKALYQNKLYLVARTAAQEAVLNICYVLCIAYACWRVANNQNSKKELTVWIMYWATIMNPIFMIASGHESISNAFVRAEKSRQLLETKPSVVDALNASPLHVTHGKVEFKNVSFWYDEEAAKRPLDDITLSVQPGQTIGIVGPSGCGKSTLAKLLLRSYDVKEGSIKFDDQDLRDLTQTSVHDAIGTVPQGIKLFPYSIKYNLRYARPEATSEELEDACRRAHIHNEIMGLSKKYETNVGESEWSLSGGQRQRIAIAQLFLKSNIKFVILDEATSAIDTEMEAYIQREIQDYFKGCTIFVIAHRLSTIVKADKIIVLNEGKIIESGTHAELLDIGGSYKNMWRAQVGSTT